LAPGEVIVFANQKAKVEAVVAELVRAGAKAAAIHGDMDQVCASCV
jgi:superfamily II DNA/RNA helicase